MIRLHDLAVGYRGEPLISGISFDVARGEVVTLVGPNGAGKSTILKTVTRQLPKLAGSVLLDGDDVHAMPLAALARRMAVVLTERVRPDLMTCYDIVASGRYPYTGRLGILSDDDRRVVGESLQVVDALDLADRPFLEVSDGQRQRVLLARAFAQQPDVIVLDEPTSFLDIRYQLELLTILRALARDRGIAVLMSLHEIDLACRASDRLVCVGEHAVTRVAEPDVILREGSLVSLFGLEGASLDPRFSDLVASLSARSGDYSTAR